MYCCYINRLSRPSTTFLGDRYNRNRYYRYSRRYPSYSRPRSRPRASERDMPVVREVREVDSEADINRVLNRIPPPSNHVEEVLPEIAPEEVPKYLNVTDLDLHIDNNCRAHNTDDYEMTKDENEEGHEQKPELVIRRGQEFTMTITFDRPYDIKKNDIALIFNLGDDYKPNKYLSATIKLDETGNTSHDPTLWSAKVVSKMASSLTLSVFVPASVPIGEWELSVRTTVDVKDGKDIIWQYNHNTDINIIFNPWCKEDWVYMPDEKWRSEAVMNDSGPIYYGSDKRMGARNWNFGQFDNGMLEAAFHLVRKGCGYKTAPYMSSAAAVSRMLSQLVNSNDDNGVLQGNWSGNYDGGTSPTAWVGSVKILEEYMASGPPRKPVRYGQCWVFSGVLTTVCRALGIPTRSVTNFSSAHNTDSDNLSIEKIQKIDDFGNFVEADHGDSVWNYHCWNEVWMARPDLDVNGKWDGWQVIDATPQEFSEGVFCCGPSPLKCIKEGEINIGKDAAFIFSEVNADRIDLQEDKRTGELYERKRRTAAVGKKISTHSPTGRSYRGASMDRSYRAQLNLERLDLTLDYKYKEGSQQERDIYKKADKMFRLQTTGSDEIREFRIMKDQEVEITMDETEDVFIGNSVTFNVNIKNTGEKDRSVKSVVLRVFYKTYHATYSGLAVMKEFKDLSLYALQTKSFEIDMEERQSTSRPQDGYNFEVKTVVSFYDTDFIVTEDMEFRFRRPDVHVVGPEKCRLRDVIDVTFSFTNPFSRELTRCKLDIEGGFTMVEPWGKSITIPDIAPNGKWTMDVKLRPRRKPRHKIDRDLSVGFESVQLKGIIGYYAVELKD